MPSSKSPIMETDDTLPEGPQSAPAEGEVVQEPAAEVLHLDQYSEYLLHSPREILAVLRQVVAQGDLVTVYFNSGKDFLLTTLLAVNDREVLLDRGSSDAMNRRALEAGKIFCITRHDKVKLQFILTTLRETQHEGRSVFSAALPETLLRLQRREYFRLRTPITRPLICDLPVVMSDGSIQIYPHEVIDISIGGLSLHVGEVPFVTDQEWPDCALDLPQIGVVRTTLRIVNMYETTLRNGQPSLRAGCQFVDLPVSMQNLIQRYIVRMERERKARESGLA